MDVKLPFGLQDGQLVDISLVESGLACNCVCPCCEKRLVAKKGNIKEHHFAHHDGEDCNGGIETALHIYAKDILEKHKRIVLPPVYLDKSDKLIFESMEVNFDKVVLEKRVSNIIPDIIVFVKGKPLLIEIAVTHFVDVLKAYKIFELGYSAIEINAKGLFNSAYYKSFRFKDLEKLLIEETNFKRWINNLKENLIKEQIKKLSVSKKAIYTDLSSFPIIVENCPINKRTWKSGYKNGQSYACVLDDCYSCPFGEVRRQKKYFYNEETESGRIRSVDCSGHRQNDIDDLILKISGRSKNIFSK